MKQFAVTIPDNKETLFIELMKSLSFVKGVENVESVGIPEWHKAIIDERLAAYKTNPSEVIDVDQACDDILKGL